ncbi:calcium/proton exchanger [Meredithblackwellia eburnea MCA 4105]
MANSTSSNSNNSNKNKNQPLSPSLEPATAQDDDDDPAIWNQLPHNTLSLVESPASHSILTPPTTTNNDTPHIRHRALAHLQPPFRSMSTPATRTEQLLQQQGRSMTESSLTNATNQHPFSSSIPPTPNFNLNRGQGLGSAGAGAAAAAQQRPILLSKTLFEPKKPVGKPPGWRTSAWNVVKYSYLNILLVFVPISWAMHFSHQSATVTFVCSFGAIVPLAALLGFATEELALRVGDTFGGLLNATFGNAVELIISILALVKGELRIVQSSMLGSILSNCLLVLGMCYFAGGLRFHEQGYGVRAAQLNINLLGISVAAIVIPVAFHAVLQFSSIGTIPEADASTLKMSRGIAIILLVVYAAYLTFQLWTHAYLYIPAPRNPSDPPPLPTLPFIEGPQPPTEGGVFRLPSWGSSSSTSSGSSTHTVRTRDGEGEVDLEAGRRGEREGEGEVAKMVDHDKHEPKLSLWASFALLFIVTVITGFTAEWLVDSISGLTATGHISTEFVALILLPLVGNAAEHVTAVTVATKNKLDLSMAVAVGSSIQISLFVIPLLIILGWIIGQPLTLFFDVLETIILFVSILAVQYAISDGRTNWLEGFVLMVLYVLIAVVIWYYPGMPDSTMSARL